MSGRINPSVLTKALIATDVAFVAATPDSRTAPLLRELIDLDGTNGAPSVLVTPDEASAVSMVAGATFLSGVRALAIMEASGLRRAYEALARLALGHGIFPPLLITVRGGVGERDWWAIGQQVTLVRCLEALGYAWEQIDTEEMADAVLAKALATADIQECGVAVLRNF